MAEKQYRVTHNPYKRTTKVEEYYPGASNPWKTLGSEKEPELNYILERKESIQQICLELLEWLEGYNNRFCNCKPYEVVFNGIEQDFYEIETIGKVFQKRHGDCKFMGIIQPEKFWDVPNEIQSKLEGICNEIREIYKDEKDLLEKIEKCFDVIDQNLNILILGMQNSGKSTLINALLGKEILPTSDGIETAALYTIESGDADRVIIYPVSNDCMEISIKNNGFEYNAIGSELDQIVGNISQADAIKNAQTSSEIIKTILKELNTVCQNRQVNQGTLFLKEVKIKLKDFEILGDKQTVCIKDFPGAGAQYLGKEHKAIVQEEIENITNAVTINVLNVDNSTFQDVHDFNAEIKNIDDKREGDIGRQIDFARSIYVLNKADSVTNWEEKKRSVRRDFQNKKVVFCCAEAAVQMTARRRVLSKYKPVFVKNDEEELLDLQSHALLPAEYSQEKTKKLTSDMASIYREALKDRGLTLESEDENAIKNTGLILCAGLIKEYADNFASVNRTRCYYQAVRKMMEQLKQEEKRQEDEKKEKKIEKEKEQKKVRDSLKEQCEQIVKVCKESIKKDDLHKELQESTLEYLNIACGCVNGLKEIKKIYRQQNKEIKKDNKEKQKVNKIAVLTEKKDWRMELGNEINETIIKQHSGIKGKVNKLLSMYCEKVKQQLIDKIQASKLTSEEEGQIKSIISEYNAPPITGDNYKMPKRFEFSFNAGAFGKFIFSHSEWQEDRISDSIRDYWSETIIDPYSDQLIEDIKKTLDELLEHISKRLDAFAPELINLQKEIDGMETRLSELRGKIEKSKEQCELCERIVESGAVSCLA